MKRDKIILSFLIGTAFSLCQKDVFMNKIQIPEGYAPVLDEYDTQRAIAYIKQTFQNEFAAALFFISLGLLCGSVMNSKQVGGICGALLTNLAAWLSGAWFDLELVGGAFKAVADVLPYAHAVELQRAVLAGNFDGIVPHLYWVIGYAIVATLGAVILFLRQMKRN